MSFLLGICRHACSHKILFCTTSFLIALLHWNAVSKRRPEVVSAVSFVSKGDENSGFIFDEVVKVRSFFRFSLGISNTAVVLNLIDGKVRLDNCTFLNLLSSSRIDCLLLSP